LFAQVGLAAGSWAAFFQVGCLSQKELLKASSLCEGNLRRDSQVFVFAAS